MSGGVVRWILERRAVEVVRRSFLEIGCRDMATCGCLQVNAVRS